MSTTHAFLLGCIVALALATGCGDDTVSGTGTEGETGTGSSGLPPTTVTIGSTLDSTGAGTMGGSATEGVDTTATGDSTATGDTETDTSTDTDTDTDTGEPMQTGHTASSFVNAGTVSSSPGYRLVWTFGQETQNQNTMDSPGYTLHGGLVGAVE